MSSLLRSLRFRLTLTYVVIFGVIQLLVWVTVDVTRTSHLYRQFDQTLIEQAQTMAEVLQHATQEELLPMDTDTIARMLGYFQSKSTAVQVRRVGGDVIWRSSNLLGLELPLPHVILASSVTVPAGLSFENIEGPVAGTLGMQSDTIRMITLIIVGRQNERFALQLARSLEPLESVRDDIRWLLLLFGVISLVVAGATSWIMTGRSMQPIADIARQARAISTANLGRRLPQPGAADEIGELVDVINAMLDRLQSEIGNQRQFISNVSHELKTPLTVLLGEVQAVERMGDQADMAAFARSVHDEARRMLRTVQSFLILSRVQRGDRLSVVSDVPIDETVIEAVQSCQDSGAARGVRIVANLDIDDTASEPVVRGDGDLLRSMFENLIHNAVRHSPEAGVVRVETVVSVKDATVTVTDRGPGIPEDHLHVIFEPFIQANPTGPGAGSAGVGLAIAKGVADLHGGTISADNLPGGGAKFTVRLPLSSAV